MYTCEIGMASTTCWLEDYVTRLWAEIVFTGVGEMTNGKLRSSQLGVTNGKSHKSLKAAWGFSNPTVLQQQSHQSRFQDLWGSASGGSMFIQSHMGTLNVKKPHQVQALHPNDPHRIWPWDRHDWQCRLTLHVFKLCFLQWQWLRNSSFLFFWRSWKAISGFRSSIQHL